MVGNVSIKQLLNDHETHPVRSLKVDSSGFIMNGINMAEFSENHQFLIYNYNGLDIIASPKRF